MEKILSRKIEDIEDAEEFCRNILFNNKTNSELRKERKALHKAANNILTQELLLEKLAKDQNNTFKQKSNRLEEYRDDVTRELLREKIANECLRLKRIPEKDVKLGKGGMLPNSDLKKDSQFYLVIGLPASGKSTISENLADLTGSVYLDCDIIKRKIPEFSCDTRGASLVHVESNYILRPSDDTDNGSFQKYNIMLNCFQNKSNIVYNIIGDNYEWVKHFILMAQEANYTVHLLLVELDRIKSVNRAYQRFVRTGRYISLPLIYDVYSNNPTIAFYKCTLEHLTDSYAYINNDVEVGAPKKVLINNFADKDIILKISNNI